MPRTSHPSRKRRIDAFTLVELLVVIAIIGLLAGIVGVNVMKGLKKGRQTRAKADISNIANACDMFKIDMGYYPQSIEDLISPPADSMKWDGPYLKEQRIPLDPWGAPYDYQLDNYGYTITSWGSDGQEGGMDEAMDIDNHGDDYGDQGQY